MVVKTKEEAKENFSAATAYIPDRYLKGTAKADWKTPAESDQAEANFKAAMTDVLAKKLRQEGIKATSNAEWQAGCKEGASVIGTRISAALDKWVRNWGPKYDRVVSVVKALPPKTRDWKTNVNQRLMRVVEEWIKE
jgi:hypothetical protein